MKTYLLSLKLILIVLLFASAVNAQIILNSNRKPVIGDSFTTKYMDTTGVTEGPFGSNIAWDFSNLIATGEQWNVQYVDPSAAPGDSLFPDADIAVSYDGLAHTFYDTDGNSIHSLGVAYEEFEMIYSNTEKVAEFPFTLSSSFIDSFHAAYELGEGMETRNFGRIRMIGDAFGTIVLPDGSTRAALRIKIMRESSDTLLASGIPIGINTFKSTTYEWYTNESKYPVLGISSVETQIFGIIHRYKKVDYNIETPTDVEDESPQIVSGFELLQNYPNPFNPSTKISWHSTEGSLQTLKVYNILGTEVATLVDEYKPAGSYEVDFDASNLSSGVYLYKLQSGDFVQTRKMTLIK
jgi:hypothetical protein